MIIKNLTRKAGSNTSVLLNYLFKYISEKDKIQEYKPFIVRHNVRSSTIAGYIKEFAAVEQLRLHKRIGQVNVHHSILSFGKLDAPKLNDSILRNLAKQYIKLRGELNLYVITKHLDREHIHLHVAMSATQVNGKSSSISKARFAEIKQELDRYQQEKYPELVHSLPQHGKQKEAAKAWRQIQNDLQEFENIRNGASREAEQEFVRSVEEFDLEFPVFPTVISRQSILQEKKL